MLICVARRLSFKVHKKGPKDIKKDSGDTGPSLNEPLKGEKDAGGGEKGNNRSRNPEMEIRAGHGRGCFKLYLSTQYKLCGRLID